MTVQGIIPEFTQGDRLRKARQLTGLTAREFADLIGVSAKTVNNAEGDSHAVRRITMNAWALATGVSRTWLETGQAPAVEPEPGHSVRHQGLEPRTRWLTTRAAA
jgi:transcriptional regulator with XRE-family HTH domain